MRNLVIIIYLLLTSCIANAVSYKYLYATKDKANDAVLVSNSWIDVDVDQKEGLITVSFEDREAKFLILKLIRYTENEIIFRVLNENGNSTIFAFYDTHAIFVLGDYSFILIDIPRKDW